MSVLRLAYTIWFQEGINCLGSGVQGITVQNVAPDDAPDCRMVIVIVRRPVKGICIVKYIHGLNSMAVFCFVIGVTIPFLPHVTLKLVTEWSPLLGGGVRDRYLGVDLPC